MDAIIFDGSLSVGDDLVIAGVDTPIVTKVKALFAPDFANNVPHPLKISPAVASGL